MYVGVLLMKGMNGKCSIYTLQVISLCAVHMVCLCERKREIVSGKKDR